MSTAMGLTIRAARVGTATLVGLLASGCGHPTDEQVKRAFLKENPTFTVVSVVPGEGDGSTVYMHVRYRPAGNSTECEVEWGFQEAEPEWRVFHKGRPRLVPGLSQARNAASSTCNGTSRANPGQGRRDP
jgi:hypothetical protein